MTVINSNRAVRGPVTAIPLVAGKGVKITADTVNNRYVAEVDETVLMDTETLVSNGLHIPLSENFTNFERIRIEGTRNPTSANAASACSEYAADSTHYKFRFFALLPQGANSTDLLFDCMDCELSASTLTVNKYFRKTVTTTISTATDVPLSITKIVGINRIASN